VDAQCACGEKRPEALIPGSNPTICAECERKRRGQAIVDNHHVAGKANSPATIQIPANDHRAELSEAQYDWPKQTLENPDGSPLLAAAACIRGFVNTIYYLIERHLLWIPEMLETLHNLAAEKLGPKWWRSTALKRFEPKKKL
jgi:hypothetical protein